MEELNGEASSRVPMTIVPPKNFGGDAWNRGTIVSNLTSLLDVYPTLLEIARVTARGTAWRKNYRTFQCLNFFKVIVSVLVRARAQPRSAI